MIRRFYQLALFSILFVFAITATATTFRLPPSQNSILGEVHNTSSDGNESVAAIAERYDLGVNSLLGANPSFAVNQYVNGNVVIPAAFILPPLPRRGIIINLPEMRLYYFLPNQNEVMTFPVGIGRVGKTIPITMTAVIRKVTNPTWIPPEDIRAFNLEKGIELPDEMGPGPDNPLGPYAIYLRVPTYLIHSTIFPESIGTRASFGCIRMNENDIRQFFPIVTPGTPVAIVDMPVKVGWEGNRLYLQAYPPLEERRASASMQNVVKLVEEHLTDHEHAMINWQLVTYLIDQPDGIPHEIGFRVAQ